MNKNFLIIISVGLAFFLIFIFSKNFSGVAENQPSNQNIEIKDGVQYITINAKGGYFPNFTEAKAGIPTKLIVKTNGTYDCSAALVVRDVGFQKILSQTGETEIDLGAREAGKSIEGICSMGMFSFNIDFK